MTARGREGLGWVLLLLLVLSPTHTKLAGLLWLLACLSALVWVWRSPVLAKDAVELGTRRWLWACTGMLALWQAMALYWQEPCCAYSSDIHSGLRLWLAAPLTAMQLQGVAFVHAVTSLSNVNHAHNYYAVMLSLSVLVAFVLARSESNAASC